MLRNNPAYTKDMLKIEIQANSLPIYPTNIIIDEISLTGFNTY